MIENDDRYSSVLAYSSFSAALMGMSVTGRPCGSLSFCVGSSCSSCIVFADSVFISCFVLYSYHILGSGRWGHEQPVHAHIMGISDSR